VLLDETFLNFWVQPRESRFKADSGILGIRSFESLEDADDMDGVRATIFGLCSETLCIDFFGS